MTSTSCSEIARRTLEECLAGRVPEFPAALAEDESGDALFGILVEGLADRFEPALCDAYVKLFSQAVAQVAGLDCADLQARYARVRQSRGPAGGGGILGAALGREGARAQGAPPGQGACSTGGPGRVFVLSRVTLGADIAVTSVVLAAAKRRFPEAEIVFVGPRKNFELFAGDPRISHAEIRYQRGGLRQRLATWEDLKRLLGDPDCLVIDPDSRLTQLGLLPVCGEDRYRFFESRAYGGASALTLPELAAQWAAEAFGGGTGALKPYIALAGAQIVGQTPGSTAGPPAGLRPGADEGVGRRPGGLPHMKGDHIAVSLGVGENPAKGLPDPFEEELLRLLASAGAPLYLDKGAGGEEAARVERAVARSGAQAKFWEGSFAGFAGIIAASRLYVGYDSAGQHVAAACGVPLISVFAGFPVPRMFDRWRPAGERCHVIRVDEPDVGTTLERVRRALAAET